MSKGKNVLNKMNEVINGKNINMNDLGEKNRKYFSEQELREGQ